MAAVAGMPVNGIALPPTANHDRLLEYQKILRLHDEIFAGSHPRLTVPAHAIKQVSKRVSQSPLQQHQPIPRSVHSNSAAVNLPGLQLTANHEANKPPPPKKNGFLLPAPAPIPKPHPAVSMPSGIDPVLLTKSDDLIRAETQLARQRLEKSLKEQFEHKRAEARRKPAPGEARPDVDLSAALTRALETIQSELPTKPSSPDDGASASDSFDENSLYSSRAPDSTPEEIARARFSPPSSRPAMLADIGAFDIGSLQRRGLLQEGDVLESSYQTSAPPSRVVTKDKPQKLPWQLRSQGADSADLLALDDEEDDEGEYSPPEPEEQIPLTLQSGGTVHDGQANSRRTLRRYSELDHNAKGYGQQPNADMRIVRNQITSPLAPQPSRVSPLAVAKAPLIEQNTRTRKDRLRQPNGRAGDRSSPETGAQAFQPRKKRKVDRAKKGNRPPANGSPDTFVKGEPVSPPPFHDKQPLGARMYGAANRPIHVDDTPTQEGRFRPMSERYVVSPPHQAIYEVDPGMSRSEPRPSSRSGLRPLRDDQDLRKVASMQNLRFEQPREYTQPIYETPSRTRATSYVVPEPSGPYNREPLRERVVLSPAPAYRGFDQSQQYERTAMMPPPRRRIMVDEYGNEYEMIPRASVTPRATPLDREGYEDTMYSRHRASPVYAEPPTERRYVQEMAPPPQISYRRVAETPRISATEMQATWREPPLEPAPPQRSASVLVNYPPRQVVYADDRGEARGMRMASVRPVQPLYDDLQSREPIQRVQSVRPARHDGSVYANDQPQMRREYVPVESPRYRVVSQGGRYYEMRE